MSGFETGLANSLAGYVNRETQRRSQDRRQKEQRALMLEDEKRKNQHEKEMVKWKEEVHNVFKPASPEMRAFIKAGDFDSARQLAMQNPNDAKHLKRFYDLGGKHAMRLQELENEFEKKLRRTSELETARQDARTKGYAARAKLKPAKNTKTPKLVPSKSKKAQSSSKNVLKNLKTRARYLKKQMDALKDDELEEKVTADNRWGITKMLGINKPKSTYRKTDLGKKYDKLKKDYHDVLNQINKYTAEQTRENISTDPVPTASERKSAPVSKPKKRSAKFNKFIEAIRSA